MEANTPCESDAAGLRVLYERFGTGRGAFGLIDDGHINAWRSLGAEVRVWTSHNRAEPSLETHLLEFRPGLFLASLQSADRGPAPWLNRRELALLAEARHRDGLRVAARSAPSNLADLMRGCGIDFESFPDAGVKSFYTQPPRPTSPERDAIEHGVIDLIRSPLHHACFGAAFQGFLDAGLSVLEEMHAADATRYAPLPDLAPERPTADVLFIGNCWPFKWRQMGPHAEALRARFGERFVIRGRGWPEHIGARDPVPDEGAGADNPMNRLASSTPVHVALHEPTQVLGFPFTGNERPYKLMLMGLPVISDANPVMADQFDPGREIEIAPTPEQTVAIAEGLLADPARRRALAEAGAARAAREHTYLARARRLLEVVRAPGAGLIWPRQQGADPITRGARTPLAA